MPFNIYVACLHIRYPITRFSLQHLPINLIETGGIKRNLELEKFTKSGTQVIIIYFANQITIICTMFFFSRTANPALKR
jgi:hypothetical protein